MQHARPQSALPPKLAAMLEHGYSIGEGGSVCIKQPSPTISVTWTSDGTTSRSCAHSLWSAPRPQSAAVGVGGPPQRTRSSPALKKRAPYGAQTDKSHPASRAEVLQLCHWLQTELASRAEDEEAELQVWDEACRELSRQAGVVCAERGRLLELSRQHFMGVIEACPAREEEEQNEQ